MLAGKPVYVEKPMAASYSDCVQMNAMSRQTAVPLFVAYYRRSLPYFKKVKELVDTASIGTILLVHCKLFASPRAADFQKGNLPWRVLPEVSGGGYFYDMACHTLDLLDYIFGAISEVSGVFENRAALYPAEDVVTASFKFHHSIPGSGAWCFTADPHATCDIIEIIGSRGKISFSTFEFTPIILENALGRQLFHPNNPEHIQQCGVQKAMMMVWLGPVSEAAHGGHSSAFFDLIVGFGVLTLTWVGYLKKEERQKISIWIAIGISAICAVFIYSGIKELIG